MTSTGLTPTGRPQRRLGPRDPAQTSRMMRRVRSKDSKAELALRRALHGAGLRYRLHVRDVPGRPDMVVRCRKLAVFVDGDVWHGNSDEARRRGRDSLADLFPSRTEWWMAKIARNVDRDREVTQTLTTSGSFAGRHRLDRHTASVSMVLNRTGYSSKVMTLDRYSRAKRDDYKWQRSALDAARATDTNDTNVVPIKRGKTG